MRGKLGRDDAQGMFNMLPQQRTVHHFSHVTDVGEGQPLDVLGIDVFHVLPVSLAEHDFFQASTLGGEDFSLMPPDRRTDRAA